MPLPLRLQTVGLVGSLTLLAGCGVETLCATSGFDPTPKPRAVIKGRLGDLPGALSDRVRDLELTLRAVSVDGAELARGGARLDQDFELALPEAQDHFNLRLAIQGGSAVVKTLIPEARAGAEVHVGTVGGAVTAHALLAERSAEIERGVLASMPPQVLAKVLANAASSSDADVAAFRAMVRGVLDETSPSGDGAPAFEVDGAGAASASLEAAGVTSDEYITLRDRAARAIAVPVVCDPARLRTLFTCDVSGQAVDGNGVLQFIRQPSREGKVFLGVTVDPLSPVADVEGTLKRRLTPNDADTEMFDDGTHGDEVAGDKVFSLTLDLPRGMRVLYKYMNGSAGEGFTGTEEWPGNARILEVRDLLTGVESGAPDCVVVRRDAFGDEATNKNFVNLNSQLGGGALGYQDDLGGQEVSAPLEEEGPYLGGLALGDIQQQPPLTPAGVAEARENGTCDPCPPPLTVATDDAEPPRLVAAAFTATDRVRATFSEDLDLATASDPASYALVDPDGAVVAILAVRVRGAQVTLEIPSVNPVGEFALAVEGVADASVDRNVIAPGAATIVGPDRTPPQLLEARASSITELNPIARPEDPSTGQVVVLTFDEVLDRISAENAASYALTGAQGGLSVHAAFQRGRDVLLVTDTQSRGAVYSVAVDGPFDPSGNMIAPTSIEFTGLALYRVRFGAVVDYAFLSVDGSERGLPSGEALYLTGTVLQHARAADGRDLRVSGARTDVAGIDGYAFAPSELTVAGAPVHSLDLYLPPGTYAWKVGHGSPRDVVDPPPTLEAVSKNLCTTNDNTGVSVDPVTLMGRDGISYAGARLSLSGNDTPGPSVIFKRENPDERLTVTQQSQELPVIVVGAWRDVPFGSGHDYDDGRAELDHLRPEQADADGPQLLDASAPCSFGVLLSFDEMVLSATGDIAVEVVDGDGVALNAQAQYVGAPVRSTQVFVQTATMFPGEAYTLTVTGVRDAAGNVSQAQSGFFVAPATEQLCQIVDEAAPEVVAVEALRPDRIRVRFSEAIHSDSASVDSFAIEHREGGVAPTVEAALLSGGGTEVLLLTSAQEIQAPYRLLVTEVQDTAQPPNTLALAAIEFTGFGEYQPPTFEARAVDGSTVWVRFDEPVTEASAAILGSYSIAGLALSAVEFSGASSLRASASSPGFAPLAEDQVLLTTAPQTAGQGYTLEVSGVEDLSGNATSASAGLDGVAEAPRVELLIEYLVSRSATVFGAGPGGASGVPGRAISTDTVAFEREGVFIRGTALLPDGATKLPGHPVTVALGGFPERGAAELSGFTGPDPQLFDDATHGDQVAGDGVYSLLIEDVPLGTTMAWKAFASFSVAFRDANPEDARAALADATPGPSQYSDGEEFPGNDNGARLVADSDGDGRVVLRNLFGDEVTYKRFEDSPVFVWIDDEFERIP